MEGYASIANMNLTYYAELLEWFGDGLENRLQPYLQQTWEQVAPYISLLYAYLVSLCQVFGIDIHMLLSEIDRELLAWCFWICLPIVVVFLLPLMIVLMLYGTILFLHFYKARHSLRDAYTRSLWDGARLTVAMFWEGHGKIWHGYEIHGFENFPVEGPAVFCYYHGAIPVDFYYMMASVFIKKGRTMVVIGDKFLFYIPGFKLLLQVFDVTSGTKDECKRFLQEDRVVAVAPGGVREAFFSDSYYRLVWGQRVGFAKCAIEAKVESLDEESIKNLVKPFVHYAQKMGFMPIIPVFTQNCREGFRSLAICRPFFIRLYEKTRLPVVPVYGGFPVKWRTFIGKPIPYQEGLSPEEFASQAKRGIEDLIRQHQRIPGDILSALLDRFS